MELDDSSLLPKKKEAIKEKRQEEEDEEDLHIGEDDGEDESYMDDVRPDTEIEGGLNFEELKTLIAEAGKADSKIQNKKVLGELNGYLKNLTRKTNADQTADCKSVNYFEFEILRLNNTIGSV